MRNSARLDEFYEKLKKLHKRYIPDWRFGQFMYNFVSWMLEYKKRDIFFPEEDSMIEYIIEYLEYTFPGLNVDVLEKKD